MKIQSRYKNFEVAIDDQQIRHRLRTDLKKCLDADTEISRLYVTRVFLRKDGGFNIQYELSLDRPGRKEKMILCGHLLASGQELPAYVEGSRGNCMVMEDIGLVIPVFPYDPGLPSLKDLTRIQGKSSILKKLESVLGEKIEISDIEVLGYRLEKRCVFRYGIETKGRPPGARKIVAKAYRPSRFAKILKFAGKIEDNGFRYDSPDGISIPRILGSDDELSVIFMENVPGISLHLLMEKDIFIKACSAAGGTLRKLHNLDADELKNHSKLDELGNLQRLLELIFDMYPNLEDTFNKELNSLKKNAGADYPENVYSHRDFFDKQILHSENHTTLLDYDNAAAADPALDAGNFLAHLTLRMLQHPRCSGNIRDGSGAFLASYGDFQKSFLTRTAWWTKASRLRLAALYLLRPRWRDSAYKLLTQPTDLLGQQAHGGINEK